MVVPLSLALRIIATNTGERLLAFTEQGWYDQGGLWRPFTKLRSSATPFPEGKSATDPPVSAAYVQDLVSAGVAAAMQAMSQATHERFQHIEDDIGALTEQKNQLDKSLREGGGAHAGHSTIESAGAVSRMLSGGEGSCTGRRSREADSSMYKPGYDPSRRRDVDELHERQEEDADAVSHMLNGGDESSKGRRSREADSSMYKPGYGPSINKTRRDHQEGPPNFLMHEMSAGAGLARPDPRAGNGDSDGTNSLMPDLPDSLLTLSELQKIAVASKKCLHGVEDHLGVCSHELADFQDTAKEDQELDTGWVANTISCSRQVGATTVAPYFAGPPKESIAACTHNEPQTCRPSAG